MKDNKITRGKPDLETESFKAWCVNKKRVNKLEADEAPEVEVGNGLTIKLIGFVTAILADGRNAFAYKFRHDKKLIIYHNWMTPTDGEEYDRSLQAIKILEDVGAQAGYEVQDQKEVYKSIQVELPGMEARARMKREKKPRTKKA